LSQAFRAWLVDREHYAERWLADDAGSET
jgi:hypothetical protein